MLFPICLQACSSHHFFRRELGKVLGEKGIIAFADVEHVITKSKCRFNPLPFAILDSHKCMFAMEHEPYLSSFEHGSNFEK